MKSLLISKKIILPRSSSILPPLRLLTLKNSYNISTQPTSNLTFYQKFPSFTFSVGVSVGAVLLYLYERKVEQQQEQASKKLRRKKVSDEEKAAQFISQKYSKFQEREKRNFIQSLIFAFTHFLRFIELMIIFTPTIVLLPLRFFQRTKQYWLDTFVKAVERAGVVWIKSFQYLSHRRDLIGVDVAEKFTHLRQHAPEHSFEETRKDFRSVYGKQIEEVFEQFDEKPIASGSVSQVYRAKYHGKKVAVKVRHPKVDKHITRDINLLFFFSRVLSLLSKSFSIPVTEDSMKRTLNQQINFINEKQNLIIFKEQFKDRKDISFPQPFEEESSDSILIEEFVEGVPITYYEEQEHELRPVIARLGAETFFDMLIKHNFIHADAHGGNIMVEITDKSLTFFGEIKDYFKQKILSFDDKLVEKSIESDLLRKLYKEGSDQASRVRKIIREANQKVMITLIDAGMVITLDESDRKNFIYFLKNVIEGNGNECARLIYNLSTFNNVKIKRQEFPEYLKSLTNLFQVIDNKDLDNLPGLELFTGLLDIIRQHKMKLQGEFATLLTNMLVLEGLAKDIWPEINILKIGLPYLNHLEQKEYQSPQPKLSYEHAN